MNKKDMALIVQSIDLLTYHLTGAGVLNDLDKARINRILESEFGIDTGTMSKDDAIRIIDHTIELANTYKEMLFVQGGGEVH